MHTLKLGITGVISGFLSYFLFHLIDLLNEKIFAKYLLYIGAGLVFGIVLWIYSYLYLSNGRLIKHLLWVVTSSISYYVAVFVTIYFVTSGINLDFSVQQHTIPMWPFVVSGLTGGFLMLIGFRFLLSKLTLLQFILLCFLAAILGLSWFLGQSFDEDFKGIVPFDSFLTLYVIWQAGMAFGLGWCLDRNREIASTENPTG